MKEENSVQVPSTKDEFEAYCRAVDEANKTVIENAEKRDGDNPDVK